MPNQFLEFLELLELFAESEGDTEGPRLLPRPRESARAPDPPDPVERPEPDPPDPVGRPEPEPPAPEPPRAFPGLNLGSMSSDTTMKIGRSEPLSFKLILSRIGFSSA